MNYLDFTKDFHNYQDEYNTMLHKMMIFKNTCKQLWLKDHGWENEDEFFEFLVKEQGIVESEKNFLEGCFKPVPKNSEFISTEKNKRYGRYALNTNFDQFVTNTDYNPKDMKIVCIITFKDSWSMIVDYSKDKYKYSLSSCGERVFTVFRFSRNGVQDRSISILLFKNRSKNKSEPIVGISKSPFCEENKILYLNLNDMSIYGDTDDTLINEEFISDIKDLVNCNRYHILRYWDIPEYTSEELNKDLNLPMIFVL